MDSIEGSIRSLARTEESSDDHSSVDSDAASPGSMRSKFAANQNEAEAGSKYDTEKMPMRIPGEYPDPMTLRSKKGSVDPSNAHDGTPVPPFEGPFAIHAADAAAVWKYYVSHAKVFDKNLANTLGNDLDPLLIFAGLFSAILTAFLIESRQGLEQDPQSVTNSLLMTVIARQHNASAPETWSSTAFEASTSTRWVNGLWFSSLMFSLISALGASVGKSWVAQFSTTTSGSVWRDAQLHCSRLHGLQRYKLEAIVQFLPILIHLAFFLFAAGLVVLLVGDDLIIGITIGLFVVVVLVLYLGSTLHPAFNRDSPFRTPVFVVLQSLRLLPGSPESESVAAFPKDENTQKARVLTRLLSQSRNEKTINETIRAIAGLPASRSVQLELSSGQTLGILSRLLFTEFMKIRLDTHPDTHLFGACLYALLHLVHHEPGPEVDKTVVHTLIALLDEDGPLSMGYKAPPEYDVVAICVVWRIIFLFCDQKTRTRHLNATKFFETDLPILIKTEKDDYNRQLLLEIQSLELESLQILPNNRLYLTNNDTDTPGRRQNDRKSTLEHSVLAETVLDSSTCRKLMTDGISEILKNVDDLNFSASHSLCEFLAQVTDDDSVGNRITVDIAMVLLQKLCGNNGHDLTSASERSSRDTDSTAYSVSVIGSASNEMIHHLHVEAVEKFLPLTERGTGDARAAFATAMLLVLGPHYKLEPGGTRKVSTLLESDSVRKSCSEAWTVKIISARLNDTDSIVRQQTLETLLAFLDHVDLRPVVGNNEIILQVIALLGDNIASVRRMARRLLFSSLETSDLRTDSGLLGPKLASRVVDKLNAEEAGTRQSVLKCLTVFLTHNDLRTALRGMETVRKTLPLLRNVDDIVREAACDFMTAWLKYDDLRPVMEDMELVQGILELLGSDSWCSRHSSLKCLTAFLGYSRCRDALVRLNAFPDVVALLGDRDADVRRAAREMINEWLDIGDLYAPELFEEIFAMLDSANWWLRQSALECLRILSDYDYILTALETNEALKTIIALLKDPEESVRKAALKTVISWLKHGVLGHESVQYVIAMLISKRPSIRHYALQCLTAVAPHTHVRDIIVTIDTVGKVVKLMSDPDQDVRKAALNMIAAWLKQDDLSAKARVAAAQLAQQHDMILDCEDTSVNNLEVQSLTMTTAPAGIRQTLRSAGTIRVLISLLADSDKNVRQAALGLFMMWLGSDNLGTTGENIEAELGQHLLAMLNSEHWPIRQSGLEVLAKIPKNTDIRALLSKVQLMQRALALISAPDEDVRQAAFEMFIIWLKRKEDLRPIVLACGAQLSQAAVAMLNSKNWRDRLFSLNCLNKFFALGVSSIVERPETIQTMVALLRDRHEEIRGAALATLTRFLKDANIRRQLNNEITQIVRMLNGSEKDYFLLEFMTALVGRNKNAIIPLLAPVIVQEIIPQLTWSPAPIRESHVRVIVLLPSLSSTLKSGAALIALLENTSTAETASRIIAHFSTDAQFRDYFLESELWKVVRGLLQSPPRASAALRIIEAFAVHDNTRMRMMDSRYGIVRELLAMLAQPKDPNEFLRWQVGLKGLLALGVFSF